MWKKCCHLVVHWSNIHSTGKFFQIKSCGGNKMPALRLYFRVKYGETGRSEFPTDVPKFQLTLRLFFCPQGETSACLLCPESF